MVSGSDDSINNSDSSSDNHTDQDMANSNNEVSGTWLKSHARCTINNQQLFFLFFEIYNVNYNSIYLVAWPHHTQ